MLDREEDRALYRQLADLLRAQIRSGELAPGAALPSETFLAQTHGLSRTAVRRSIDLLVNEGLVTKVKGRRTAVRANGERSQIALRSGDQVEARMPSEEERRELHIPAGEPLLVITRSSGAVERLAGSVTTLLVP